MKNTIIAELREGSVKFKVQEDGTETYERRPPTSKDLRAATSISNLVAKLEGLARAYNSLGSELGMAFKELEALKSVLNGLGVENTLLKSKLENYEKRNLVPESVVNEEQPSVRNVHEGGDSAPGQAP